jgi:hypothetical protein
MSLKPLSSRQVENYAALPNIGSPAFDTLDDILLKINNILGSISGSTGYIAQEVSLPIGITSYNVTIPTQPDTSFVAYALMENLVDANPQFQEPIITNKTTTGFTVNFNYPLNSSNYVLSYIVPYKVYQEGESPATLGKNSSVVSVLQSGNNYGVIAALQNYGDTYLQFQTPVITAQGTTFTASYDAPVLSSNYVNSYMIHASASAPLSAGTKSATISLPVNYGSTGYGIIAVMQNIVDSNPFFQPLLLTSKGSDSFKISWNGNLNSSNYILYYYVITLVA